MHSCFAIIAFLLQTRVALVADLVGPCLEACCVKENEAHVQIQYAHALSALELSATLTPYDS